MKEIRIICLLWFLAESILLCQDKPKNILGVSAGIVPSIMDMYFDEPFDFWPDRELSPVYHILYARQVNESFRIGSYLEYEKTNFSDNDRDGIYNFKRYNLGLNWLGQFPKTAFHMQGGHAWYESSGSPSGVMLYTPRLLLKIYYKF